MTEHDRELERFTAAARDAAEHGRTLLPFDPAPIEFDPGLARIKPAWVLGQNGHVFLRCSCAGLLGITRHSVDRDGDVGPSVLHRAGGGAAEQANGKCGWHVFVRLDGWIDGEIGEDQEKIAPKKNRERGARNGPLE